MILVVLSTHAELASSNRAGALVLGNGRIVMILEMESLTFFSANARRFVRTRHLHAQQIRTAPMGEHGFKRANSHA